MGKTKKDLAERHILRRKYWTALLERAKLKTKLHANISPGQDNWISTSASLPSGLSLSYVIRRHDGQVELYIDQGQDTGDGNTQIFNALYEHKDAIERDFGDALQWESLEGKRACRIKKLIEGSGYLDENDWPAMHERMIDAMIRLDQALRPRLKNHASTH